MDIKITTKKPCEALFTISSSDIKQIPTTEVLEQTVSGLEEDTTPSFLMNKILNVVVGSRMEVSYIAQGERLQYTSTYNGYIPSQPHWRTWRTKKAMYPTCAYPSQPAVNQKLTHYQFVARLLFLLQKM